MNSCYIHSCSPHTSELNFSYIIIIFIFTWRTLFHIFYNSRGIYINIQLYGKAQLT